MATAQQIEALGLIPGEGVFEYDIDGTQAQIDASWLALMQMCTEISTEIRMECDDTHWFVVYPYDPITLDLIKSILREQGLRI